MLGVSGNPSSTSTKCSGFWDSLSANSRNFPHSLSSSFSDKAQPANVGDRVREGRDSRDVAPRLQETLPAQGALALLRLQEGILHVHPGAGNRGKALSIIKLHIIMGFWGTPYPFHCTISDCQSHNQYNQSANLSVDVIKQISSPKRCARSWRPYNMQT